MDQETRKLYRSRTDRVIGGVAGGLAHYFKIDPVVVRVVFILLALASGVGILLYIAMLIVVPEAPVHGSEGEQTGEFSKEEFKEKMKNFGEEMKSWGEEMGQQHYHRRGRGWFGLILVLIGAFLLINQLVPNYFRWDVFWPALIILVGVLFIFRSGRR